VASDRPGWIFKLGIGLAAVAYAGQFLTEERKTPLDWVLLGATALALGLLAYDAWGRRA
jgi:hypothetical protein